MLILAYFARYLLIFFIGSIFGSLLNVVIYRLPRGTQFVKGRSECPGCGEALKSYDMLPVLSYVLLRGKCRNCKMKISGRYPLVETISGHLVLSTLHTNDAVSSIVRFADMGVQPYLTANALAGIVAQRLIRKVCPNCGYDYVPDKEERETLGADFEKVRPGKGCELCNQTGYKGGIAVHEIFEIDKSVRRMIARGEDLEKYTIMP